ncbi:hypothetical protein P280DRAFT_509120 [Massarina eburnea CBS 473.64]|uniref:Oxidoreductase acuF-like C2H2 type zinc-finger domain-containing protein n=1 Tax=Massarina eburnea CBS 473.64 TaxID=1395130 RepID=A0A6A6RSP8_9PLEO|nr:hypothetical protein P280DRAFT_509120 [Massarina eburnea CBS 473.64]
MRYPISLHSSDTMSIFEHHERCAQKFLYLSELLSSPDTSRTAKENLDEEIDRYTLWAGNVGAQQPGNALSLDYRLREASFYRDKVVDLLSVLDRHLDKAIAAENRTSPQFDGDSESETEDDSLGVDEEDKMDGADSSTWDISDTDSETSIERRGSRGNDETRSDSDQEPGGDPNSLHAIRHTIDCLYQLPLRRPAAISRIREESEHELQYFEHFDILYVRDKFPQLAEFIAARLGKLITRRRQLLLYRKGHQEKLQKLTIGPKPAITQILGREMAKSVQEDIGEPTIRATSQKTRITAQTKATTANVEQITADYNRTPESRPATSVAASESTRQVRLNIPPRPALNPKVNNLGLHVERMERTRRSEFFECNYCRLLPTITSDLAWKRHVLSDLRPYVCTFTDCELSSHFFTDRDTWYAHETQDHRTELHCNTSEHRPFKDRNSFLEHMEAVHGTRLDLNHAKALHGMFQRPTRSIEGTCNLCMRHTKKLKLHVSRHLEQLALFAIPRTDYVADDEADDADSNVAHGSVDGSDEKQSSRSEDKNTSSSSRGGISDSPLDVTKQVDHVEVREDESTGEHAELIPDIDTFSWDFATEKFQTARLEQSKLPPIKNLASSASEHNRNYGHDPYIAKWVFGRKSYHTSWTDVKPVQGYSSLHQYYDPAVAVKPKVEIYSILKSLSSALLEEKIDQLVNFENALLEKSRPDLRWKIIAIETKWNNISGIFLPLRFRPPGLQKVMIILKTYNASLSKTSFAEPSNIDTMTEDERTASAINVLNELEQKYTEPEHSYESFFRPPELHPENQDPKPEKINPNEGVDVFEVIGAQNIFRGPRDTEEPIFFLMKPTPPASRSYSPEAPLDDAH